MDTLRVHALRRAVLICGGVSALAARINSTESLIDTMLSGREPVPVDIFMASVDILVEADLDHLQSKVTVPKQSPD